MTDQPIRFNDGAAYERMMGAWSRLVGHVFLDWLEPQPGLRWLDVGCGNGALTALISERCGPADLQGIDPSEGQLAFARTRHLTPAAIFQRGDAMALAFPDRSFDLAVMGLVIFFVPDPERGLAEMTRVVAPGGTVATYVWDMLGGGFPQNALQVEMRNMGAVPPLPPSVEASQMGVLEELWTKGGLRDIETRVITVEREFDGFDDFWATNLLGSGTGPAIALMAPDDVAQLKERVRTHLPIGRDGRITCRAQANAIKGVVPPAT